MSDRPREDADDRVDDEVFTHGVASFDPTGERVILWTRAEGVPRVTWHLEPLDDQGAGAAGVRSGPLDVDPEHGCAHVDVDGLSPGTSYRYWFTAGDRRSPVGRTRTAMRPGAAATSEMNSPYV